MIVAVRETQMSDARETRSIERVTGCRLARRGALLAVAGLTLTALASAAIVVGGPSTNHAKPAGMPVAQTVNSAPQGSVGVTNVTYAAGQSSGWHMHSGVHTIVVLAGMLTMYDEHCERKDYAVGETYIGGSRPHLAHNEALTSLEVVVTSVAFGPEELSGSVDAPTGCEAR